jgi:hypothetical protein
MWLCVLRSLQSIRRLCRRLGRASFLRIQLPRLMFIIPLLLLRVLFITNKIFSIALPFGGASPLHMIEYNTETDQTKEVTENT